MRKTAALAAVVGFGYMALPTPAQAGQAAGVIHAGTLGTNITLGEMQSSGCTASPKTQGVDGWVLNVGSARTISVVGRATTAAGNPAGYDLNLLFINAECKAFSTSVSPSPNETNRTVPAGTKLVLVQLSFGAEVAFDATWAV